MSCFLEIRFALADLVYFLHILLVTIKCFNCSYVAKPPKFLSLIIYPTYIICLN